MKVITKNKTYQEKVLSAVDTIADLVAPTMGARGGNVVVEDDWERTYPTNDGITIAELAADLEDETEKGIAKMLVETARKTNEEVGDTTSTTIELSRAILKEAVNYSESPIFICNSLIEESKKVVKMIKKISKPVVTKEEIRNIAIISAQSKKLGSMIADISEKIGKDGIITAELSASNETEYEIVQGLEFEKGYLASSMVTNDKKMICELKDTPVFLTNTTLSDLRDFLPVFENLRGSGKKQLLIVAEDVSDEVLETINFNNLRGASSILVVRAPHYGENREEMLQDMALLFGTHVFQKNEIANGGFEFIQLGRVRKVISFKDKTTIIGGYGKKEYVDKFVGTLRKRLEVAKSKADIKNLTQRMARLTGGIAVIRVGANTDQYKAYLKDKVDDALNAVRSAIQGGIVEGGGIALYRIALALPDKTVGQKILKVALSSPAHWIIKNSGKVPVQVLLNMPVGKGYDVEKYKYVDMIEAGIIDPAKAEWCALQNAVEFAGGIVSSFASVVNKNEKHETE